MDSGTTDQCEDLLTRFRCSNEEGYTTHDVLCTEKNCFCPKCKTVTCVEHERFYVAVDSKGELALVKKLPSGILTTYGLGPVEASIEPTEVLYTKNLTDWIAVEKVPTAFISKCKKKPDQSVPRVVNPNTADIIQFQIEVSKLTSQLKAVTVERTVTLSSDIEEVPTDQATMLLSGNRRVNLNERMRGEDNSVNSRVRQVARKARQEFAIDRPTNPLSSPLRSIAKKSTKRSGQRHLQGKPKPMQGNHGRNTTGAAKKGSDTVEVTLTDECEELPEMEEMDFTGPKKSSTSDKNGQQLLKGKPKGKNKKDVKTKQSSGQQNDCLSDEAENDTPLNTRIHFAKVEKYGIGIEEDLPIAQLKEIYQDPKHSK
jgi:hypothetical protein